MVEPRVVSREEHTLSRRDIDSDALKVLYRLRQGDHIAYLVGGSVRDLLLGRRPKDFDIGTSAHPYQVKKLFRNCWIIGRRFRLAHVKFGQKVIEVATFRRQVQPGEEIVQDGVPSPDHQAEHPPSAKDGDAHFLHHDNTFGTPEEDAFRRDFTINALFYDIATFSIIDYVGGLEDLRAGVVRSIGDPIVRFQEDPVRMLRAVALAARLDFTLDPPVVDAIKQLRHEIARSSPARLLEEYYKILRAGSAEKTFRGLADTGLLEPISEELHRGATEALWRSLAAVDTYRQKFAAIAGNVDEPGAAWKFSGSRSVCRRNSAARRMWNRRQARNARPYREWARCRWRGETSNGYDRFWGSNDVCVSSGASVRAQRALTHRGIFRDGVDLAGSSRRHARPRRALDHGARRTGRGGTGAAGR